MSKQVFVGNLAYAATEDNLRDVFEANGIEVVASRVMRDQEGHARGFGFVTIEDDPENVIARMDGQPLLGRKIHVEQAKGIQKRHSVAR